MASCGARASQEMESVSWERECGEGWALSPAFAPLKPVGVNGGMGKGFEERSGGRSSEICLVDAKVKCKLSGSLVACGRGRKGRPPASRKRREWCLLH